VEFLKTALIIKVDAQATTCSTIIKKVFIMKNSEG